MLFVDPMPPEQRPAGEGADGVAVHWHPDVLLLRHPEAALVVDWWRTGARRAIDAQAYETLTHFVIEQVLTMAGAHNRAEARRWEEMRRDGAGGSGQGQPRQGAG